MGVGGSGKQSLSRLAAFISSLEVIQIQLKKGYGISDLKVNNNDEESHVGRQKHLAPNVGQFMKQNNLTWKTH